MKLIAALLFCLTAAFILAQNPAPAPSDQMQLESTDGKKIDVQLLSGDHSTITFLRTGITTPFTVPLSTFAPKTLEALKTWTEAYKERTPPSIKQFQLGITPEQLAKEIPTAKLNVVSGATSKRFTVRTYQFIRNVAPLPDPDLLATVDGISYTCDTIEVCFLDNKAIMITVFGNRYQDPQKWAIAMTAALADKYGPGTAGLSSSTNWNYSENYGISCGIDIPEETTPDAKIRSYIKLIDIPNSQKATTELRDPPKAKPTVKRSF